MTDKANKDLPLLKNGNVDYEKLYKETINLVYYQIIRLVINQETANDLVQDTYAKAFQNLDKLQNRTIYGFKAWISQIALNCAKDYLKKCKPLLFSDIIPDEKSDYEIEDQTTFEQPDVAFNQKVLSEEIQSVMGKLPEDQRLCIFLFYFADMTIVEIAEFLELSEATIKSRLKYARDKIKVSIQNDERSGIALYGAAPIPVFVYALKAAVPPNPVPPFNSVNVGRANQAHKLVGKALLIKVLISIAGIAIVTTTVYSMLLPAEVIIELNPFDYVTLTYDGWNEEGIATLLVEQNDKNLSSSSFMINTSDSLANKDTIVITFIPNKNMDNYKIIETTRIYTVSGLEEKQEVNPFDYLDVSFIGEDGNGIMKYDWQDDNIYYDSFSELKLITTKENGLSNGDVVSISIEIPTKTTVHFTQVTKDYVVDTLSEKVIEEVIIEEQPKINPYEVVVHKMQTELQDDNITTILSSLSRDYIGNEINQDDWRTYTQRNQTITVGNRGGIYFGYAEVELLNAENNIICLSVASQFNENFTSATTLYATSLDGREPLESFKLLYFGDIEIIYE